MATIQLTKSEKGDDVETVVSRAVLSASQVLTAGETLIPSTNVLDCSNIRHKMRDMVKLTNGATGPTTAALALLQLSTDGVDDFEDEREAEGLVANDGIQTLWWTVYPGIELLRLRYTAGDDQAVNADAIVDVPHVY